MTHGEAYVAKRDSLIARQMKADGQEITISLPRRMPKKDATEYYKKKFNKYWENKNNK